MYILGISCFYHESAACLLQNGEVVAASSEERFTRKKHDNSFPENAVKFCLDVANITQQDLDYVVFYEKPFWKFHRILLSALASYPESLGYFTEAMKEWLTSKLWTKAILKEKLKISSKKILFVPHHISHSAASFYPSGFETASIMTFDGVGEWTTTTFGKGEDTKISINKEIRFPHSLGLLYSVFTAFLGFEVNDGEYKVMGMAPFGKPRFLKEVKKLITIHRDGSYSLNMDYLSYHKSTKKTFNEKFIKLFGEPRPKDLHFFTVNSGYPSYFGPKPQNYKNLTTLNQHYADIAASIQEVTEEVLLVAAENLFKETKNSNLCIGGGVGLNSVANGKLLQRGPFKKIFIQPAAGDDGGAMGASLYVYHNLLGKPRKFIQKNSFFGKKYSNEEIKKVLDSKKIKYKKYKSESRLIKFLTEALVQKKVIGFFHGKAEWGPRALGSRSILANPTTPEMKDIVNVKIKFREPYRPFAPVSLPQFAKEYFELGDLNHQSLTSFMLGVFPVKKSKRRLLPAVTHIDGSARMQIIERSQNKRYFDLIKSFGDKTGIYVLLNTSFNVKGEPIVNSPLDALNTFLNCGLDILVLEDYVVYK